MPKRISRWSDGKVVAAWLVAGLALTIAGLWLTLEEEIILWIAWLVGLGALLGHIGNRMGLS
jgi:hypothetical protein